MTSLLITRVPVPSTGSGQWPNDYAGQYLCLVIAVAGGSWTKQTTLNFDLDLSEVNGDAWPVM